MTVFKEDYFALSTKLLKRVLEKARRKEPVESEFLNFVHDGRSATLDYSIEYSSDENTYLVVSFNGEPQRILLSQGELTFGTRTYLTCGCGNKTNALYLKLGYFACRECQKMHYRSTNLNKTSEHGQFLFLQNRRIRLMEMRERMDRPIYKGRYTKRFLHWLGLCSSAGMFDEFIRAQEAMVAIKNSRTQKI